MALGQTCQSSYVNDANDVNRCKGSRALHPLHCDALQSLMDREDLSDVRVTFLSGHKY